MQVPRESSVITLRNAGGGGGVNLNAAVKQQKIAYQRWNRIAASFHQFAIPGIAFGFIICRFLFNDLASYLLVGSVLSLIAESLVISSYIQLKSWRKHPSRLLLYRYIPTILHEIILVM